MLMKWLTLLALCCVAPAAAQQTDAPNFRAMSDAELLERATAVINTGFYSACSNEVPLFAELARRNPDHKGYESGALIALAVCAMTEGRDEEALRLVKQAERVLPVPIQDNIGLYLATRLEDGAEALARLRSIAESGRLGLLEPEQSFSGIRTIRAAGLDDEFGAFAYQHAASNHFVRLDPGLQGSFAVAAIRHAIVRGELSRVEKLLKYVRQPNSVLDLLANREFEAAWPMIERRAGDNLANISAEHASATAERLVEEPEDRDRLSDHAHALLYAGRFAEAATLARDWLDESGTGALEEGHAWAMNVEAYALDALGRQDEADKVFDELAKLPADENPWVVNFVINRASRLVGQQRWTEGLAATDLARRVAEDYGTPYAKLLIARDRSCALHALDRAGEAELEIEFLRDNFAEAAAVATTGLLCAGLEAEVERRLATVLSDEQGRDRLIPDMQDARFDLFSTPTSLPQARDFILAREELREKVLDHVRLLPERFVPIGYLRRQPSTP
jgi:tetratricopeptide (TPR) repeat protein